MPGAIHVGIMPVVGRIFNVGRRDGDTTFPFLGSLVDGTILKEACKPFLRLPFGDCSCQGRLAVIDMTNCTC